MEFKFTCEEHLELRKKLIGSICRMSWGGGVGLILDSRRWHGDIQIRIAWVASPFIRFKEERKIGWHNYTSVTLISTVKHPI